MTLLIAVGWVALIVLCIEVNYSLYSSPNYRLYSSLQDCFFSIFFQLLGVQLFLALFPTAYYCSSSVSLERSTRSLPLLRATPLSGYAITFGKMASEPAQVWLLLALAFPFTVVCAAIGKLGVSTFAQGYALLLAAAFFAASLGLVFSALGKKLTKPGPSGAASIGLLVWMLFLSQAFYSRAPLNSLAALSPIPFLARSITQRFPMPLPVDVNLNLNFLGVELHPFFISFPLYVLLGIGCVIGASRRIADDDVPVLSRAQTFCAYVLYQLAVCGIVVNFFHPLRSFTGRRFAVTATGSEPMVAYALSALFGIVAAGMISTPVRHRVESSLRRSERKVGLARRCFEDDAASPFPLIGVLLAAGLCGYVFFSRMLVPKTFSPLSLNTLLLGAAMLFLCVTVHCLLVQSSYLTRSTQPVGVAAAALALYVALPLVLNSVLQLSVRGALLADRMYALNPAFALVYALSHTRAAYASSDTAFFALGAVVYVSLIIALSFGIVLQMQEVVRHIGRMRQS